MMRSSYLIDADFRSDRGLPEKAEKGSNFQASKQPSRLTFNWRVRTAHVQLSVPWPCSLSLAHSGG